MKLEQALNNIYFSNYLDELGEGLEIQFIDLFQFLDMSEYPKLLSFLCEEGYKKDLMKYVSALSLPKSDVIKTYIQDHEKYSCELLDITDTKIIKEKLSFLISLLQPQLSFNIDLGSLEIHYMIEDRKSLFLIQNITYEGNPDPNNEDNVQFTLCIQGQKNTQMLNLSDATANDFSGLSDNLIRSEMITDFAYMLKVVFNTLQSKVSYMIQKEY